MCADRVLSLPRAATRSASLWPLALKLVLPLAATPMLPCPQCLFCARRSSEQGVLLNSRDNPVRCIITLLRLILLNGKLRSQRNVLAHGGPTADRAEIPTRLAAEPLGGALLGLWSSAQCTGSGRDVEEEILFLKEGLP